MHQMRKRKRSGDSSDAGNVRSRGHARAGCGSGARDRRVGASRAGRRRHLVVDRGKAHLVDERLGRTVYGALALHIMQCQHATHERRHEKPHLATVQKLLGIVLEGGLEITAASNEAAAR